MCEIFDDYNFIYACATGISMDYSNRFSVKTSFPCNSLKFPAACFRFKAPLFNLNNEPCINMDKYHTVGCLFGEGFSSNVKNICKKYDPRMLFYNNMNWIHYISCLEGYWYRNRNSFSIDICNNYKNTPIFNSCKRFFLQDARWDWNLLENLEL